MYDYVMENVIKMYRNKEEQKDYAREILLEINEIRGTIERGQIVIDAITDIPNVLSKISCLDLIKSKLDKLDGFEIQISPFHDSIIYNRKDRDIKYTCMSAVIFQHNKNTEHSITIDITSGSYGSCGKDIKYTDPKSLFEFTDDDICIEHTVKEIVNRFLDILEEIFQFYID